MSLDLEKLFGQMGNLEKELREAQERLKKMTVEVSYGGGAIKVVANGQQLINQISLLPELVRSEEPTVLGSMIAGAVNDALMKSREMIASEVGRFLGGGLPGLPTF
ncbi:MAG: YbaB/EbfC family nucleoid-associated protein [Firmicutes bacterium]|nr:YbaB/EbfC family nucleoid-associated protein [Bacillota bacterium]